MDRCATPTCVGSLSSFFESRLGICADCCAKLVDLARKMQVDMPRLQEELAQTNEYVGKLTDSYEAEKLGTEAARRGFNFSENPFSDSPDKRAAWAVGWSRGSLERRTAQAIAVIEWAVPVLEMTEEIALGTKADEIAAKVRLVREKLGQFV